MMPEAPTPQTETNGIAAQTEANGSPAPATDTAKVEAPKLPKARDWAAAARAQHDARQHRRAREASDARAVKAEADLAQHRTARENAEKELATLRERVKGDALAVAAEVGGNVEANISSYVEKTAPERKIEALEKRLAEIAAKDGEREAAREKHEKAAQAEAMNRARHAAYAGFVQTIRGNPAKTPHLHQEFTDQQIYGLAKQLGEWAEKQDATYTYDEVQAFLEKQAKLVHDQRIQREAALRPSEEGSPDSTSEKTRNGQAAGHGHRDTTKQSPASRTTQQVRSSKQPISREEEAEHDLAALRSAMARDAASRK